jgi:uncharacterized phage protein (TIGR02216 family)
MRLGLGVLRLCPRDFWAATPREIAAAFPPAARQGLARGVLETLMQRFPDET